MTVALNLAGVRSGKLVAIERKESTSRGSVRWLCQCDCGNQSIVIASNFRKGQSKSCGCSIYEVKHGGARKGKETRTYQSWLHMRQRCLNESNDSYHNYGGRGITICSEWDDFEKFLYDMGERPHGLTIDRIDNNKGYYKENCRWASKKTQLRNKRNNRIISWRGKDYTAIELCEMHGISHQVFTSRLKIGWDIDRAITQPVKKKPDPATIINRVEI